MSERDLFVICPSCSSEVSPYVTECPYCGNRLRKRAPDLKKQRAAEAKAERREEKRRARLRAQYEGGPKPGAWLELPGGSPRAIILLVTISVLASVVARSSLGGIAPWAMTHLVFVSEFSSQPWTLVTSPLLQSSFGYGFVCLFAAAVFGSGIELRFGAVAAVLVWLICGACGVLGVWLLADVPVCWGAYSIAVGFVLSWTIAVGSLEGFSGLDTLGLAAVAAVLCLLPLATDAATLPALIGGIVGGASCGGVLSRLQSRG